MEAKTLQLQLETEQYNNQANLVYVNTIIFCSILVPLFHFVVGSTLVAALNFAAILISILCLVLNHQNRYGTSALLFIGYITFLTAIEVFVFGLIGGFQYFFFNMTGLIMFSSWSPRQKLAGVLTEATLFICIFFLVLNRDPVTILSGGMTLFFHTLNVLLNLSGIANSANYYIRVATRARQGLSNLAMRDYLTGLMNRTAFDGHISGLLGSGTQGRGPLGILLLDIDHFKKVNDTYGHLCGDEMLRQFSAILSRNIRPGDYAARYGGEEFVVLAPMEDPTRLRAFAERLRRDVESMEFSYLEDRLRFTVSIGALFIQDTDNTDHRQALDLADRLLYRAKAKGRNRVVLDIAAA